MGFTILHGLSAKGMSDGIRKILSNSREAASALDESKSTPLHYACMGDHKAAAEVLILDGHANVNAIDELGQTPVYLAAQYGSEAIVQMLLHHGGDPRVGSPSLPPATSHAQNSSHRRDSCRW